MLAGKPMKLAGPASRACPGNLKHASAALVTYGLMKMSASLLYVFTAKAPMSTATTTTPGMK